MKGNSSDVVERLSAKLLGQAVPIKSTAPAMVAAATDAGLVYVTSTSAGFSRRRRGKGFVYLAADGKMIREPKLLARIAQLGIPPAWRDVWICPLPNGHIQAMGLDDRGRKQYRYHDKFRQVRDETKFARMREFARALPRIRRRVARDVRKPGLPWEKVVATVVRLLETTLIRVGNDEYARTNHHYGLTTLRNRHAKVNGNIVKFHFKGKSGVDRAVTMEDRRVARIVRRCQDLPGEELFGYVEEDGQPKSLSSTDVNNYLHEISGDNFTAKDFRTWAGTVLAVKSLKSCECKAQTKKNVLLTVKFVAKELGNTPAVCRNSYIHPVILQSYTEGKFFQILASRSPKQEKIIRHFTMLECDVLRLI